MQHSNNSAPQGAQNGHRYAPASGGLQNGLQATTAAPPVVGRTPDYKRALENALSALVILSRCEPIARKAAELEFSPILAAFNDLEMQLPELQEAYDEVMAETGAPVVEEAFENALAASAGDLQSNDE